MTEIHSRLVVLPMYRYRETPWAAMTNEIKNFIATHMPIREPVRVIVQAWKFGKPRRD